MAEHTINEAAQCARTVRTSTVRLVWMVLALLFMSAALALSMEINPHISKHSLYWLGLPVFAIIPLCGRLFVEQVRANRMCCKLNDTFATAHGDPRQHVSSTAIGPLLDMLMSTEMNVKFFTLPAKMLGGLLKSVQEEVVITKNQRNLIHKFVIQERWDRQSFNGPKLSETELHELRPAAIIALAIVGDDSSIIVLERFARRTGDLDLRASALQSITQIRERLQYGPEQLLRPSKFPERPDTLLRAASGDKPQNYDQEQLLRANNATADIQNQKAQQQTGEQATSVSNSVKN